MDSRPTLLVAAELGPALSRALEADYRLVHELTEKDQPDVILTRSLEGSPLLHAAFVVVLTEDTMGDAERADLLRRGASEVVNAGHPQELLCRIARLLATRQQRGRLQGELDSLTYSVSHDLRAPLRAVGGFSELLLSEYGVTLAPEARHYLERVCSNAQRLSDMVDDLLSLSRLFRDPPRPKRLDLTCLAHQFFDHLRAQQPSRSVTVQVQEGLTVFADRRLIRTVWENLLDNAWKFTGQQVEARIEVGGDSRCFWVRDNGVGYEPRYAEHLFAPFQRMHREAFPGRGIGLATAARIMVGLGGTIWGESSPGAGATFYISLPELAHSGDGSPIG